MAKFDSLKSLLPPLMAICLVLPSTPGHAADPPPTSWQLGYKATGYSFQTENRGGQTNDHYHHFHGISGRASGLAGGWLSLRGAARFAGDQLADVNPDQLSKLYTGVLEARVKPGLKALVGRQFVAAGVANLTLDGALVNARPDDAWDLTAWAGARAPTSHAFEIGEFDQDPALGGRVSYRANSRWRLGLSTAYRERAGQIAERPLGADVVGQVGRHTRVFGRVAYDLEQSRWARVQAQGQWRHSARSPVVDLQYIDRHPSIDAASWFSRFTTLKRIRLARLAVRHEMPSRFGGEFEYLGSFVGERTSSRVGAAVLVPGGRVGYSLRLGDAGEENRFFGELSHQVTPWLELGAEASLLTYALLQDAPADQDRDVTTLAARARVDLRPGMRILAEVQSLDNPLYDEDVRFLMGLDISMARGTSRLGLDRGGWLR